MQAKEICLLVNHNTRYYSHSIWEQLLYSLDQTPRYYLFHHPILCGIYSRVATNREWCLLIPANLSLISRPLLHFQCTLNTADESEESDPWIWWIRGERICSWWQPTVLLKWTSQATSHLQYAIESRGLSTCTRTISFSGHYFFQGIWRCGFYLRAVTNWEWRLFERIRYSVTFL